MNPKPDTSVPTSNQKHCENTANDSGFAFEKRLRSHMDTYGWSRVSPSGNEKKCWQEIIANGSKEKNRRTAYIHIPFCGTLCTFCNFLRKPGTSAMAGDYAKLVIKELQSYKGSGYIAEGGFEALYFGGGTPSLLDADSIVSIVSEARQTLGLDESAEITFESTIHDLSDEKLLAMKHAGVNRISFGVQTFDSEMRNKLGRLSNKEEILKTIQAARDAGIRTLSADILYRLPGQGIEEFQEDLQCAVDLGMEGVSLYPLIAMEGTPLEKHLNEGKVSALSDLSVELQQSKIARDFMLSNGYRQDTSTHFSKPQDRNLYANIRLDDGDCLPLGSSAGGYLGPLVVMNAMNKKMYQMLASTGKPGYMASVMLPPKSRLLRSITGQLQRGFIDLKTVWQDESLTPKEIVEDKIDEFVDKGLLIEKNERLELTSDGWSWCYNIAADFADIGQGRSPENKSLMPIADMPGKKHPHWIKKKTNTDPMHGFSLKDISVLGVMCALVVVIQVATAMVLHVTGIAIVPGLMQFIMSFTSCVVMYIALKKVSKAGALSIMSAVYSVITMLVSGGILMGLGLLIGGVLGDISAKMLGGIRKTIPMIIALVIYRTSQTTFSKLYAFITEMTQVQFVWYLVVLSIAASAIGAAAGGFAGMKLSSKISKAGVMA